MTAEPLIWLTESDVVELIDLEAAIEALEHGLALEGAGEARNVPKALGTWGDGSSMHSLGSMFPQAGYVGFKTWANTKQGAQAIFSLFSAHDGALLAMIEAVALGQLRTSAISGVATRWLARPDADEMALIGTGLQAITQVAAVAAVRPLKRLRVFSPRPESRSDFVERARKAFAFKVEAADSVDAALEEAPIVTLVTRARQPFLRGAQLARGSHLNAVGAILPQNAEFEQDVFDRAGPIVVDHLPNAQLASKEFITRFGTAEDDWSRVQLLSAIVAAGEPRPPHSDVSLFKAMGMGISDLSVAVAAYEQARERGFGRKIAQPGRMTPRWRSAPMAASVA
jgi:ornithine cyclodeaminase